MNNSHHFRLTLLLIQTQKLLLNLNKVCWNPLEKTGPNLKLVLNLESMEKGKRQNYLSKQSICCGMNISYTKGPIY